MLEGDKWGRTAYLVVALKQSEDRRRWVSQYDYLRQGSYGGLPPTVVKLLSVN